MMTKRSIIILLLGLACFSGSSDKNCAIARATAKKQAMQFEQIHRYFGKVLLTVSSDGLRLESQTAKFIVTAKPPVWNVSVFRDDDKTMFQESQAQLASTGMISGMFMTYHDNIFKPKVPPVTRKISTTSIVREVNGRGDWFDFLPLKEKYALTVSKLLHAIYKTPTNNGIPLHYEITAHGQDSYSRDSVEGNKIVYLKTIAIQNVLVDPVIFEAPAGYKKVKFVGDVTVSNHSRVNATDLNEILVH